MILDEIVREKRRLVALQKQQKPLETLMAELAEAGPVRDFAAAVDGTERLRIIAEIKQPIARIFRNLPLQIFSPDIKRFPNQLRVTAYVSRCFIAMQLDHV